VRAGIEHIHIAPTPAQIDRGYLGAVFYEVPVVFNPRVAVAEARGFWPLKRIVIGTAFAFLDWHMQRAVLLHELWHCRRFHMEQRLAMLPFCWLRRVRDYAMQQELDADAFVASHGFGPEMINVIRLYHFGGGDFHPSPDVRIAALHKEIEAYRAKNP
jgi:hypothetical protein